MSREKYVQETLSLPTQMPLFNYNINFEGLKKLLQGVNLKTNSNEQSIIKLQQVIRNKLPTTTQAQKRLNSSLIFGVRSQQYIDEQQNKAIKISRNEIKNMSQIDQYCLKMNKMAEIVQLLVGRSQDNHQKMLNDGKRYEKMLQDSIRRLQQKLNSQFQSFSQTINSYFSQTNKRVEEVAQNLSSFKLGTQSRWTDLSEDLSKKVSDNGLKARLEGVELRVKNQLQGVLKNDQMLRLGLLNEIKQAKIDNEKDQDLKNKSMAMKMQQLSERVAKAMQTTAFEVEKHKIYERLSELKNRGDELSRRNNEFVEFRKGYLVNNEKVKEQIICIRDEMKKLNNQGGSSKGEGMGSFNSHIICELQEGIKLHEKQIGKLEKQLLNLDRDVKNGQPEKPKVEVNYGQSSDLIQKIIKEFMSNMDFEGRVKRTERQIVELKKRHDNFSEIEKKVYTLTKEMNMSWLLKEMDKKCNEEDTRKEIRIVDSKVQQLFEYYKQMRKEVQEKNRKVIRTEPIENASLITKKLVSVNCISCKPSSAGTRRNYSKNKFEASLDYGLETIKSTVMSRMIK